VSGPIRGKSAPASCGGLIPVASCILVKMILTWIDSGFKSEKGPFSDYFCGTLLEVRKSGSGLKSRRTWIP